MRAKKTQIFKWDGAAKSLRASSPRAHKLYLKLPRASTQHVPLARYLTTCQHVTTGQFDHSARSVVGHVDRMLWRLRTWVGHLRRY